MIHQSNLEIHSGPKDWFYKEPTTVSLHKMDRHTLLQIAIPLLQLQHLLHNYTPSWANPQISQFDQSYSTLMDSDTVMTFAMYLVKLIGIQR